MPRAIRRKSVYYAHAMCTYGHPTEDLELLAIKDAFPHCKIINPAGYDDHPDKRSDVLGFCFRLIDNVDGVVFSRLLGKITCGVGAEINYALKLQKDVYELRDKDEDWELVRLAKPVKFITRPATIALYRKFRAL